ncbi:MAG: T9SS type A sorting domain-containing protein [Flavobacteriales bacterium]|nr:T9SS type A sorting domain-containing protein [Flavobacteriales bacterium]
MRKCLLSLLCGMLGSVACFPQFVEISHRGSFSNNFNEFVRHSDGEYVIGKQYHQGDISILYSVGFDSVIWEDGYYNVLWDASQNAQGNIVLFVSSIGCDFVQQSQLTRLEIAANGQVLSSFAYPYMVYGNWDYGTYYDEDENFYLFWNSIIKIDQGGNEIFQTVPETGISDFKTVINGFGEELLAFTGDGHMAIFDSQGILVDTLLLTEPVKHSEKSPYGGIFLFSETSVYMLDSAYTVTNISSLLGLGGNIQDYVVDSTGILLLFDDEVLYRIDTSHTVSDQTNLTSYLDEGQLWLTDSGYFCSGTLGNFGVILRLDSDLNVTSDVQVKWMKVSDLNVFDGEIQIVGTESHFPHQFDHPSALLKTFDTDLTTGNWQNDVELVVVTLDSISTSINPSNIFTYQYPTVLVRNNGQNTIRSLSLSYHNLPIEFGICELKELEWSTDNLDLPPGGDTLIELPRIPWISYIQDPNGSGPTNLTLCVYAYNPNRKVEADHGNNSVCTDFIINVGVEEILETEINIYPNPFDNELIIEMNEIFGGTTVRVSDVLGRSIHFLSNSGDGWINFNTADWPNGIYVLTIESKDGRVVRKVVKQ